MDQTIRFFLNRLEFLTACYYMRMYNTVLFFFCGYQRDRKVVGLFHGPSFSCRQNRAHPDKTGGKGCEARVDSMSRVQPIVCALHLTCDQSEKR